MDPTPAGDGIISGYLDQGVLGLTILLLILAIIYLWRAREQDRNDHEAALKAEKDAFAAYRDKVEVQVREDNERRFNEQGRILETTNSMNKTTEAVAKSLDRLTDSINRGSR